MISYADFLEAKAQDGTMSGFDSSPPTIDKRLITWQQPNSIRKMRTRQPSNLQSVLQMNHLMGCERELLLRLAAIYLACRWRLMGHKLTGNWPKADLAFDLLGMLDYAAEMRLLVAEWHEV